MLFPGAPPHLTFADEIRPEFMTRFLLIALFSTLCTFADEPAWPGVKFSEVRAFAWPDDKVTEAVILEGMTLKDGSLNPEGAILTPAQTKALITAVTGEHAEYPAAMCHIPHNAFVFYDSSKNPVAFVEICFGCSTHRIMPKGAAMQLELIALATIFNSHRLPIGEYSDLASYKKSVAVLLQRMKKAGYAE